MNSLNKDRLMEIKDKMTETEKEVTATEGGVTLHFKSDSA